MEENQNLQTGKEENKPPTVWPKGGATGLDRDEGEISNGVIGGTGSELDRFTEKSAEKIISSLKKETAAPEDEEEISGPPY